MEVRQGFDLLAAQAMKRAMRTDDPTFIERAAQAREFFGFYDPEPIGAAVITDIEIHIGVTKPGRVGFAVRRLVKHALQTRERLYACFSADNRAVERLCVANGFLFLGEHNAHKVYGRLQ